MDLLHGMRPFNQKILCWTDNPLAKIMCSSIRSPVVDIGLYRNVHTQADCTYGRQCIRYHMEWNVYEQNERRAMWTRRWNEAEKKKESKNVKRTGISLRRDDDTINITLHLAVAGMWHGPRSGWWWKRICGICISAVDPTAISVTHDRNKYIFKPLLALIAFKRMPFFALHFIPNICDYLNNNM